MNSTERAPEEKRTFDKVLSIVLGTLVVMFLGLAFNELYLNKKYYTREEQIRAGKETPPLMQEEGPLATKITQYGPTEGFPKGFVEIEFKGDNGKNYTLWISFNGSNWTKYATGTWVKEVAESFYFNIEDAKECTNVKFNITSP